MDPLSHALVGLSLFGMQHAPALSNPACVGAVIGAIAPDFDIAARIKGDYVYLKHHRVETHSFPGIMALSLLITLTLSLFYHNFFFREVFFWTLIGGVSHTALDILNSYGASILYPLNRKKYTLNLLMIYDPILILMNVYIIFFGKRNFVENILLLIFFGVYVMGRRYFRNRLRILLETKYDRDFKKLELMPSTFNPLKWDFIVETESYFYVGEINSLSYNTNSVRELKKVENPIIQKSLKEELGMYFKSFTPFFHVDVMEKGKERIQVKMTDLRYRMKNQFMHHAFFHYNKVDGNLINSNFLPFSSDKKLKIYENNQ
ncbi:metal-dependent hydrolase [Alkaliphilus transvaalensis]|uniref:metal-dependent hydrolase n=1 Tax=Alkaliphilus transvaalensis TaxID=114628 RepID=UPI000478FFF1|nr:metal-dependent hydrolase [Alkaliphilus transvaalensis]